MMPLQMASRRGFLRLLGTALVALEIGALAIGALSGCASTPDTAAGRAATDPLPSWNDTAPKQSIVTFVERVTREGSPDFVPVPERIAVFDNDGTLWAEQPMYFQGFFVIDRVNGKFISAKPFTEVNWATGYDKKGRPIETPGARSREHASNSSPRRKKRARASR